ncbi:hypothetical protein WA026_021598 [Henosepilachna vigintioctopunctata]|uniref:Uncharacterized protein n=1 Tax=Henosepilachna vigintioctopunctata TaxID=420089 RepID=A0AAW1UXY1_9CUCU
MQSFKLSLVLFATLMIVYGTPEFARNLKLFEECAETNGFKVDGEKLEQILEGIMNGDKKLQSLEIPQEFLCTEKCFQEKMEFIEEGKFNLEKVKVDKMMLLNIPVEKIESYLNCLKEIEVKDCEDMKKLFECRQT